MRLFITLSFLILALSASANQSLKFKSYIVTKTNDTIYGRIKANYLIGGLKLVTKDSTYKIDANIYSAYYNALKKTVYRSRILPGFIPEKLAKKMAIPQEASWLKCIEDGKIKLYEVKSYTYGQQLDNVLGVTSTIGSVIAIGGVPNSEFTSWYIEKNESPITPIKYNTFASGGSKTRKERKELLKELLADNDTVSQSYDPAKAFTFKEVRKLVHEYNNAETRL